MERGGCGEHKGWRGGEEGGRGMERTSDGGRKGKEGEGKGERGRVMERESDGVGGGGERNGEGLIERGRRDFSILAFKVRDKQSAYSVKCTTCSVMSCRYAMCVNVL